MTATMAHPYNGKMGSIMMAEATAVERGDVPSPAPRQAQDTSGCMDDPTYTITISSMLLPGGAITGTCAEIASTIESLVPFGISTCDDADLLSVTSDFNPEKQFELIENCPVSCKCPGLATPGAGDQIPCPGPLDSIGYPCPAECCTAPCCPPPATCPTTAALDAVNNDDDPDNDVPPNIPSTVCSDCGLDDDGNPVCCSVCVLDACISACAG